MIGLGPWGPYGKRYFGLSYLPGPSGVRIDIIVALELHRRSISIPHAIKESGYLPWSANEDLSNYSYRQQILAKDQLYADVKFKRCEEDAYQIEVNWTNNTPLNRDVRLHLCVGLQALAEGAWQPQTIDAVDVALPSGADWVDALDYISSNFGCSPAPGLNADGRKQGECVQDGFVGGLGIEWPAGNRQHKVDYAFPGNCGRKLQVRYKASQKRTIQIHTGTTVHSLELPESRCASLSPVIELPGNCESISIQSEMAEGLRLDGLHIYNADPPIYSKRSNGFGALKQQHKGKASLHWENLPGELELELGEETFNRSYSGDLEQALLLGMHNHVSPQLSAPGVGYYHDFIFPKCRLSAHSSVRHEYIVRWKNGQAQLHSRSTHSEIHANHQPDLEGAEKLRFGVDRLAATLLTNLVYPVRIKGSVIRHFPPGRWWDMLYTWDCGFIGLGLGEIAPRRAVEILNTYVTEPGDPDCAYIQHGSPVPVQHYLYFDLWQKTQDRNLLAFFYPRLAQFLRYIAGLDERSPMRPFKNSLISSWPLFYNSGGWDDYPPQYYLHNLGDEYELRNRTAPMVMSSHVAAAADIMAMAARELNEDPSEWENLAESLSADMDAYAWDPESGLYGYLEHTHDGTPLKILSHDPSGQSYNLGLDGAMPLLTGRINSERAIRILKILADTERFLTPLGLSTVDQTAPYYQSDGYWNGATWIPYQYIFWKVSLDAGDSEFARKLALRVLRSYNRETEDSYCCFEHFMNDSGRGAGWHHFGGLSSPIINFFAAYFRPGRINTGFRAWLHSQKWEPEFNGVRFEVSTLMTTHTNTPVVLVTINPKSKVSITINDQPVECAQTIPGLLELPLRSDTKRQKVEILGR